MKNLWLLATLLIVISGCKDETQTPTARAVSRPAEKARAAQAENNDAVGPNGSAYAGGEADAIRHALSRNDLAQALERAERLVASSPADPSALIMLGEVKEAIGNRDDALADFSTAIRLAPEDTVARFRRGALFLKCRLLKRAIEDLEMVAARTADTEALFQLGQAYQLDDNDTAAVQVYAKALERDPRDIDLLNNYSFALCQTGCFAEAEAAAAEAVRIAPDKFKAYYNRGAARLKMGKKEDALADFTKARELNPEFSHVYTQIALLKRELGLEDAAKTAFDEAVSVDADSDIPYAQRAKFRLGTGDHQGALADAVKAIGINPSDPNNFFIRGAALFRLGRFDEARDSYDRAIGLGMQTPDIYHLRGLALIRMEKFKDAYDDFARALRRSPDAGEIMRDQAVACLHLERFTEALAIVARAGRFLPGDVMLVLYEGVALEGLGKYAEAEKRLGEFLEKKPDNTRGLMHLGRVLFTQEKNAAAVEILNRLLALQPENADALLLRAKSRIYLGKNQLALADIEKFLERFPEHNGALNDKARLLVELEKYEDAARFIDEVGRKHPRDAAVRYTAAVMYMRRRDYPRAQTAASESIALDSERAEVFFLRAMAIGEQAFRRRENDEIEKSDEYYRAALSDATRAVELAPDNLNFRRVEIEILVNLGKIDEAEKKLTAAEKLGLDRETAARIRAVTEKIRARSAR